MKSKSLQLNNTSWSVSILGEQALLLKPQLDEIPLSLIHESVKILEATSIRGLVDIIPAYESIALVYERLLEDVGEERGFISKSLKGVSALTHPAQKYEVLVCYELGLDWDEVEKHTGLGKEEIIQAHLSGSYTVAMMGFIPGFLYLSGLSDQISCPRKEEPRTQIPAGSVGIGGDQTGIYSLESPGGWQIIGKTPNSFFDANLDPPTKVRAGDHIAFKRISENEFSKLKLEDK